MKFRYAFIAAGLTANLLIAQPADESAENWTEVNLAVTDSHVIPAYTSLMQATQELETIADAFCRSPDAEGLASFQDKFHSSMDPWQQIQHIQFGPITYFNWNFRIHYWPDEQGTGARQLDALIAAENQNILSSDNFAVESVAVQGYPALERLLFEADSLTSLQGNPYRCQVAQTITRNISEITRGVQTRWVDEFRTTVANADERGFFESAEDATIDFLKAQVEPVRRIQQQKLEEVLGESAGRERVQRAESWRSDRSLRNIRLNILALEGLFNGADDSGVQLSSVLLTEDVATINNDFTELNASLAALPDSFAETLEVDGGRENLEQVIAQLDTLFEALEAALKNTDLYLGFNSLDGD
ncbi:MAG: imelysin family protein [Gammaproteobacteria bacterium]|nr:imelysin family protein [Gammaproteobacteria bacterium]